MTSVAVALEWSCAALLVLAVMLALVRWARRRGRGTALLGSAMVLLLGIGLVPDQQNGSGRTSGSTQARRAATENNSGLDQ